MAGDIKRQRKSWTLQDRSIVPLQGIREEDESWKEPDILHRSKVSINILRANLAEEGDEDAQLDVAKRLLEENSGPGVSMRTQNENARLALYWLIKSSEQGNDEATQLLNECLQTGRGLTAQNILDVRMCVTTPKYEKLTFKAARLLHRKLSNGEEFITTTQLLARVNMSMKNVAFEENSNSREKLHGEILADEDVGNSRGEHAAVQEEGEKNSPNSTFPEGTEKCFQRNSDLNSTFIISSHRDANNTVPAAPTPPKPPKQLLVKPLQHNSSSHNLQNVASAVENHSDLQLAMTQSGKKLTLNDLLSVAKDFNLGNTPEVSINGRNRILERHVWHANSFLNTFFLQLLVLAVVGNVMVIWDALEYLIYLGCIWSSYHFFAWKLRYQNFNDWKLAFGSVLQGESWATEKFQMHLSSKYLLTHLINVLFGLLFLAFANGGQATSMFVAVGVTVIASIQLGILQCVLLGWRQMLLISMSLIYYQFSSITNILNENFAEQSKYLHESIYPIGNVAISLPFPLNMFTVMTCLVLVTMIKWSLDRLLSETLPQMVLSLWLIRMVQTCGALEANQLFMGTDAGLVIIVIMALLCSKMESWKIILVILSAIIVTIGTGWAFSEYRNNVLGGDDVSFLDWEEYETSCHRKAWAVQSPAATQIKCSSLYGGDRKEILVKWKGRITVVKVEKLSHGTMGWEDVVFDISVGIFSSHSGDDGSRNWQNFLSTSNDAGDTLAPASVILNTGEIKEKKKKQNLVDHVLNLRGGDKIEFIGRLKGTSVGSLKPQIIEVRSLQCLSCATADYGEFIVGDEKYKYGFGWVEDVLKSQRHIVNDHEFLKDYRQILRNLFSKLQIVLAWE